MPQDAWPYGEQPINEDRWRAMARLWRETGVVEDVGDTLEVSAVTGTLGLRVAAGEAWVDGHYYRTGSDVDVDVPIADLAAPRVDLVVVRSTAEGGAEVALVEGTPDSSPSPPQPTQDHDGAGVYELPLAEVYVAVATSSIDDGDVTDRRRFSQVVGGVSIVTTSERDQLDVYVGRAVLNVDENRLEVWNGDVWDNAGLRPISFVADESERGALDAYPGMLVLREDVGRFEAYDGIGWRITTGVVFVADQAERDALEPHPGLVVFRVDLEQFEIYDADAQVWRRADTPEPIADHQGLTGLDRLDVHPAMRDEYLSQIAETNLRLWQLEADVVQETEGFTGWQGEAFLTNQDNVLSVTGDVSVSRAARLGGGGLSIAASPILGLVPGDPLMGGFFVGVIDPSQVPYDSGEDYPDVSPPRYALIVGPQSLESATGQTWSSNTTSSVANTRTWWDGLRASEALISGGHSIGTWLSNLRTSDPVPVDDGSDWYVPSLGELTLIYQNLKPDTAANYVAALTARDFPAQQALADQGDSWGPYGGSNYYNPASEPPFQGYTTANPSQTLAAAFQAGAAEALDYDADSRYWSSTEAANDRARGVIFRGSYAGFQAADTKTYTSRRARPVRRVVL